MLVINKTPVPLKILGEILQPNMAKDYEERVFNTLHISSRLGRATIHTEYNIRHFRNYGNIVAKEGKKRDSNGMKVIVVSLKTN